MIILLSPAKTFTTTTKQGLQKPYFINKAFDLVNILKTMNMNELENSLSISNKLAFDVKSYYENFSLDYSAVHLYGGQAYKYLKANDIEDEKLKQLYILSPLYGIINALDSISLYRLDLKDKVINESLYQFWSEDINDYLNKLNTNLIINLSSGEFTKLLDLNNPKLITINFGVIKENKLIQQSMLIKKMRGLMANYLLINNINSIEEIKTIVLDGFKFDKQYSFNQLLMFTL